MLIFKKIAIALALVYSVICLVVYFLQEKLIFKPNYLNPNHQFVFDNDFEELFIDVDEDIRLNCLHFKATNPKGLIFYLHGNAANLADWGEVAEPLIAQGYDVLMFDYRGYGKSNGHIFGQQQFYDDAQKIYDYAKAQFDESLITILAFSIGSATGSWLTANNNPNQLILKAPYYSLLYLTKTIHPYLPSFLLKYKFKTNEFLKIANCPITIFHGEEDSLIPIENSKKLKEEIPSVVFIPIPNCEHNDIPNLPFYHQRIKGLLE